MTFTPHHRSAALPLALLLTLAAACPLALAKPADAATTKRPKTPAGSLARAVKVLDGDTLTVRVNGQTRTVDLLGIDAPELGVKAIKARRATKRQKARKGRKARLAQCGATQAKLALGRLVLTTRGKGRRVRVAIGARDVVARASTRRQRTAALRATVVRGKTDAGRDQLLHGWAKRREVTTKGFKLRTRYVVGQRNAERLRRGIWGPLCVKPPKAIPPASISTAPEPPCRTLLNPINPRQQTAIGWGQRSNWLQPWRAYLDTRPASDLANGTGIIFDAPPGEVSQAARLLAASGFRRARYIVDWSMVRRDPAGALAFSAPEKFGPVIEAFRDHDLRPMILLNAKPSGSGFAKGTSLQLGESAPRGSRSLKLTEAGSAGFRHEQDLGRHVGVAAYGLTPGVFITSVASDGTAQLSRPLDRTLQAGTLSAVTLEAGPFERPQRPDGQPNPAFQKTLAAWLEYVGLVTRATRDSLGTQEFDVEVWNELSFDSEFLDANAYHEPDVDIGTGDTNRAILEATVRYLKDPANGVPGVRVGDGFASNDPLPSGATAPPGLDAINKHPYAPLWDIYPGVDDRFPGSALGAPAVDALGNPDDQNSFAPTFRAHFPEHYLTAIPSDHLVRDLSPITTTIDGVPHGRFTRSENRSGGSHPRIWVSEHTLVPDVPTQAANRYIQTKVVLRSLIAYVGAGAELVALYSADDKAFGLIDPSFFQTARLTRGYPGDGAGGRTMDALRRVSDTISRGASPARVTPLELLSITDCHGRAVFGGDGTPRHPALFHRDVLAFFPFQTSETRYAIPYWVMTRDLARAWQPQRAADDLTRYDFPPEKYTLEIGGLGGKAVRATSVDPLNGSRPTAAILDQTADTTTVEVQATDSPRLLIIEK